MYALGTSSGSKCTVEAQVGLQNSTLLSSQVTIEEDQRRDTLGLCFKDLQQRKRSLVSCSASSHNRYEDFVGSLVKALVTLTGLGWSERGLAGQGKAGQGRAAQKMQVGENRGGIVWGKLCFWSSISGVQLLRRCFSSGRYSLLNNCYLKALSVEVSRTSPNGNYKQTNRA